MARKYNYWVQASVSLCEYPYLFSVSVLQQVELERTGDFSANESDVQFLSPLVTRASNVTQVSPK
jgi:hypothetical protein